MLGSLSDAEDAVQASWIKLIRSDNDKVENIGGWMTTIVARICLDMLRSRKSKPEVQLDDSSPSEGVGTRDDESDPEREAQLADSVGIALMVVLDTLAPDERLAFVMHDIFAIPFDDIAPIVGRSPATTRQLASRARRRVRGMSAVPSAELNRQKQVVNAFLTAARAGDFNALLNLLDPDVVLRSDTVQLPSGENLEVQGAQRVAKMYTRRGGAEGIRPALVNGSVGLIVAPLGHLVLVIYLTFKEGKIAAIEAVSDPTRLRTTNLGILDP
ncbi:MAG: sigma-70 family RNA polymerase sigma factor [Anaerolineae bacterium]|nr:sigma-70 family RNA polymerase sigma factor [Anaerolineae bacterium]